GRIASRRHAMAHVDGHSVSTGNSFAGRRRNVLRTDRPALQCEGVYLPGILAGKRNLCILGKVPIFFSGGASTTRIIVSGRIGNVARTGYFTRTPLRRVFFRGAAPDKMPL